MEWLEEKRWSRWRRRKRYLHWWRTWWWSISLYSSDRLLGSKSPQEGFYTHFVIGQTVGASWWNPSKSSYRTVRRYNFSHSNKKWRRWCLGTISILEWPFNCFSSGTQEEIPHSHHQMAVDCFQSRFGWTTAIRWSSNSLLRSFRSEKSFQWFLRFSENNPGRVNSCNQRVTAILRSTAVNLTRLHMHQFQTAMKLELSQNDIMLSWKMSL